MVSYLQEQSFFLKENAFFKKFGYNVLLFILSSEANCQKLFDISVYHRVSLSQRSKELKQFSKQALLAPINVKSPVLIKISNLSQLLLLDEIVRTKQQKVTINILKQFLIAFLIKHRGCSTFSSLKEGGGLSHIIRIFLQN